MRLLRIFLVLLVLCSFKVALAYEIQPTEQLPQVVLKENFIQLSTGRIQATLLENGEERKYRIEPKEIPSGVRLPAGKISYEVFIPNGLRYSRQSQVWINIFVNGEYYTQVRCSFLIRVYENMVVAARQIRPEKPITADDLKIEEREIGTRTATYFTDTKDVLGKVVSRLTTPGTVIYEHNLWQRIVISQGDKVVIQYDINGIKVNAEGRAMGRGRIGEKISVQNLASKKVVRATVVDAGIVEVKDT